MYQSGRNNNANKLGICSRNAKLEAAHIILMRSIRWFRYCRCWAPIMALDMLHCFDRQSWMNLRFQASAELQINCYFWSFWSNHGAWQPQLAKVWSPGRVTIFECLFICIFDNCISQKDLNRNKQANTNTQATICTKIIRLSWLSVYSLCSVYSTIFTFSLARLRTRT